jgi:uncharacterized membrane protein
MVIWKIALYYVIKKERKIMKTNFELKALAREQLRGTWLAAVALILVYTVIICLASATIVGSVIIGGPLTFGLYGYFIRKARGESVRLENLFDGFKLFGSSFLLFLLQMIFISLWTCLFIVPGIIKSFSYSMAFFILRDNPGIGALEAINASRKMMNGHKGRLFGLCLSFIGWCLLGILTLGIGYLWLGPYVSLSIANFYEDLRQNQNQQTVEE